MEKLKIDPSNFIVYLNEQTKLYNMFGPKYTEKLPEIYANLASILNSDNFFTEIVEKSLYDKDYHEKVKRKLKLYLLLKIYDSNGQLAREINNFEDIEEINNADILNKIKSKLSDPIEANYFEVQNSIVQILFDNYVNYLLQIYVSNKEPALSDCEGVKDISQCDFIIERYHEFVNSLKVDATPTSPSIDVNDCIVINKGDLFHGTRYSSKVVESIANKGLETGQLHGVCEDGETFLCIDFFKALNDSTPNEICNFGKQYTNGKNQIVFVINHEDIVGPSAMFSNLTDYDAYNDSTSKGKKAREIVNIDGLPLDHNSGASILIGVPPSMISSIIINLEIENNTEKIDFISSKFPKAFIVSRETGKIIKNPIQRYNQSKKI